MTMRANSLGLALSILLVAGPSNGQGRPAADPIIQAGTTVQVSEHVWGIPDQYVPLVPNVGIVVGSTATLVVDTELGPRNGEIVLQEVNRLSANDTLDVVSTHYHPEHSLGVVGLGAEAILVIPRIQQEEMADGQGIKTAFARRSDVTADLLRDVEYPKADILFEDELTLDLGGLTARVFHLGTLHTRGDALIFIEEDRVLFAGDVIMQGLFPSLDGNDGSIRRWQEVLDTLEALNPSAIIGAHGSFGDIAMIDSWRQLFRTFLSEVRALKEQGMSEADAATKLTSEFSVTYPQWPSDARRMNAAVRVAWRELP